MATYTAGPWKLDYGNVIARDKTCVAVVRLASGNLRAETDANAQLIAAGPELLAALEQIERLSRTADRSLVDVASMLGDIARNAVSKAVKEAS